ncbi:MAG: type II secretion system protein [Patescibacteria group bacterium]
MKFLGTVHFKNTQKGFTLVEMIVSLAIFTIVALVAVGALLKITDANKKSQTLKTAINNLNFALESMSREMRVGEDYNCMINVVSPSVDLQSFSEEECEIPQEDDWLIAFKSSEKMDREVGDGECTLIHAYWYTPITDDAYTIKKAVQTSCEQGPLVDADFQELLSPDIRITDSRLKVDIADYTPQKAFFWLKGYAGVRERERTEFEIQTSISERN